MSYQWSDLASKIKQDDEGKYDEKVPISEITVADGELVLPNGIGEQGWRHLGLTSWSEGQVCSKFDVPRAYYAKVSDTDSKLADQMLNHGIGRYLVDSFGSKRSGDVLLRMKGRTARAVLSDRYAPIDNHDVVDIVHSLTDGQFDHTIRQVNVNDRSFWMKMTCDALRMDDPSKPGTDLKMGIIIGNSEVGARQLVARPFMFRQSCTNDAVFVSKRQMSQRHVHVDIDAVRRELTKSIAYALRVGQTQLKQVLVTREKRIAAPSDVIFDLARKGGYAKRDAEAVVVAYEKEPEPTAWGVVNAFTRAAQYLDGDKRIEAESQAGSLLVSPPDFWNQYEEFKTAA